MKIHVGYDDDGDVLYLSLGPPRRAIGEETPEGYIARYDEQTGEFCGLTIVGASEVLARAAEPGSDVAVTLPVGSDEGPPSPPLPPPPGVGIPETGGGSGGKTRS